MKLEELYSLIEKDFVIDQNDLGNESLRTSKLFITYIKHYTLEKARLEMMISDKKRIVAKRREYYSGNAPAEEYKKKPFNLKIKTETVMQKYLDEDEELIDYDQQVISQRAKVDTLFACMDEIKRRGFAIKSAIDHQKFLQGY